MEKIEILLQVLFGACLLIWLMNIVDDFVERRSIEARRKADRWVSDEIARQEGES